MKARLNQNPLKKRFYLIGFVLGFLFLIVFSGWYLNYQFQNWLNENHLKLEIKHISFCWRGFKFPALNLTDVVVHSTDTKSAFKQAEAQRIVIAFKAATLFRSFFRRAEYELAFKKLKLSFSQQQCLESTDTSFNVLSGEDEYTFYNISLKPLQFAIIQFDPNLEEDRLANLIIYEVAGTLTYNTQTKQINGEISIPSATLQMPEGKDYTVHAKGKVKLLSDKFSIPYQGVVFIKINHISNFLHHLYQANVISRIEAGLGTIMGEMSSRKNSNRQMDELLEDEITLEVKLEPDSISIGSFKIYP